MAEIQAEFSQEHLQQLARQIAQMVLEALREGEIADPEDGRRFLEHEAEWSMPFGYGPGNSLQAMALFSAATASAVTSSLSTGSGMVCFDKGLGTYAAVEEVLLSDGSESVLRCAHSPRHCFSLDRRPRACPTW